MGEFERRRRRLRPSSAATSTDASAADTAPILDPPADSAAADSAAADSAADAPGATDATPPASSGPPPQPARGYPGHRSVGRPVPRPTSGAGGRAGLPPGNRPTSGAGAGGDDRETERGLRGLVGSGSSQVSVSAALRARDATRPTEAHLAEAEERLVIVRRNWSPREDLPRR